MSFIRDTSEERTGFQASAKFYEKLDLGCDFVMVYGLNETTAERVEEYRRMGYQVHLMTGIAWGDYQDYLSGKFDGREHYDESQTDRFGHVIEHGPTMPYMVPTIAFADYMTEKLKAAVDCGVAAIHVEEPEFWDRAGYSPAFRREYELYYRTPWVPPHKSVDARYKASFLKAYLYCRTIERVSGALKEYAYTKYGRVLRFYVPTHSLLNYTQWKIVSPEGKLSDIPSVDGCIAQVFTDTAREKNWLDGILRERTFETAYLEYGIMQELVRGTGRKMWFLHDPVADAAQYDWADYQENYLRTVTASLLHTKINTYEICPWPNRVFDESYPKGDADAKPIPEEYNTLLSNIFQTLGDIPNTDDGENFHVGVFMSDSELYERDYPDGLCKEKPHEKGGTALRDTEKELYEFTGELFKNEKPDPSLLLKFKRTNAFPSFFGLAMPLLKYGLPIRPVLLDNVLRYAGYLDEYSVLILSYEFMKPETPGVNNAIAAWVRSGGRLVYIGDGSDPYHAVKGWWSASNKTPAEHLFKMLGIVPNKEKGMFMVGKGFAAVWQTDPASFCFSHQNAERYRGFMKNVLAGKEGVPAMGNSIVKRRGSYIVAAVMDESLHSEPQLFDGLFADMYSVDFEVKKKIAVRPGGNALLFDFSTIERKELCVIGTSVRVKELYDLHGKIVLTVHGPAPLKANIRLRVPFMVKGALLNRSESGITIQYEELSRTVLLSFDSNARDQEIILY